MRGAIALAALVVACGAPQSEGARPTSIAASATTRGCFSGTPDNGACEVFSAAREPLSLVAAHCRASGGRWLDACPVESRVGTCTGDGQETVYYGPGLDRGELQRRCEAEGHTFAP
jgi:hypothetical protein